MDALHANGVYLESDEGLTMLKRKIEEINQHFDESIEEVVDPGRRVREVERIRRTPLFAAGIRGFERLKERVAAGENIYARDTG